MSRTNVPRIRRGRPPGLIIATDTLRSLREQRGWTQEQLAERAGLTPRTVRRCEVEQRSERPTRCSSDTLQRLANVLGVSVGELTLSPTVAVQRRLEQNFLSPPPPAIPWFGRASEAARIIAHITSREPRPLCISGPTGIGKSALARFVAANTLASFPGGVIWLSASHMGRPVDARESRLRIADALGFDLRLPAAHQVDAVTYLQAFQRELWSGRRLLILDGVLLHATVQDYVPRSGIAAMIVTTNLMHIAESFGDECMELAGLSVQATAQIIQGFLDDRRCPIDPTGLDTLHNTLCGIPRSIFIAGKVLQRQRLLELCDYAQQLADDPSYGEYPSVLRTKDNHLIASFNQVQAFVSDNAWALLSTLSLFGDVPFTASWAAAIGRFHLFDLTEHSVRALLGELIDVYLVAEEPTSATTPRNAWSHRRFYLRAHVPMFARSMLGNRHPDAVEHLTTHAIEIVRAAEPDNFVEVAIARRLFVHIFQTLVDILIEEQHLREWREPGPFDGEIASGRVAVGLVDLLIPLLPYLSRDALPDTVTWLKAAILCSRVQRRTADEGHLLLALGRFWLRRRVDLERASHCFDAAIARFDAVAEYESATIAAAEAGRALFGCNRPDAGLQRFEQVVGFTQRIQTGSPRIVSAINAAAVSFTRQSDLTGWLRAAALLHEAIDRCGDDDRMSRLMRVVCSLNLATIGVVLQVEAHDGSRIHTLDQQALERVVTDWTILDLDAPLMEARLCLVRALFTTDVDVVSELHDRARALWHQQLTESQLAVNEVLWAVGEAAFYLRLDLMYRRPDAVERSSVIAHGFALSDVSRELMDQNGDIGPIGLLFPLEPLYDIFRSDYLARVRELADEVFGTCNRVSAEIDAVADALQTAAAEKAET